MINALGLLEVKGLAASIEAADAMLKAAQVKVLNQAITRPGMITIVIEGDLAACRAALDAGAAAASRVGIVISRKEIGRPDPDTECLVVDWLSNKKAPKKVSMPPVQQPAKQPIALATREEKPVTSGAQQPTAVTLSNDVILEFVKSSPQGCSASELALRFSMDLTKAREQLEQLMKKGLLRKRGSRYRLKTKEGK